MLETIVQRERDFGTPASLSTETVTLTIDGVECVVPEGTSVMRAAAMAGINIPKLCASDNLEAFGSCRLCLVEIDGRRGYPASCTTPAESGMVIRTETPKLHDLRRNRNSGTHGMKGRQIVLGQVFGRNAAAPAMRKKGSTWPCPD